MSPTPRGHPLTFPRHPVDSFIAGRPRTATVHGVNHWPQARVRWVRWSFLGKSNSAFPELVYSRGRIGLGNLQMLPAFLILAGASFKRGLPGQSQTKPRPPRGSKSDVALGILPRSEPDWELMGLISYPMGWIFHPMIAIAPPRLGAIW